MRGTHLHHHDRSGFDEPSGCRWTGVTGIWDLIGYAAVVALALYLLVAHLGPTQRDSRASASEERRHPNQDTESDTTATKVESEVSRGRFGPGIHPEDPALGTGRTDRSADMLLQRFVSLQPRPGWTLTDDDIARVRRDLASLVGHGEAAIPAIRAFLRRASDANFRKKGVSDEIGYDTLRLALFDVLKQIGGSAAENIWYEELRSTQKPVEIGALGRYLDQASPGLYDRDILGAARDVFADLSGDGRNRRDAGPLFQVFNEFGDVSLIPELEQMSPMRWGRYAAVTLASLPDGAGLSSLAHWVKGTSVNDANAGFALGMLAQSAEYPEAQAILIESVRIERIPDARWPEFARLLAGTYRIQLEPPSRGVVSAWRGADINRAQVLKSQKYISRTPGGGQVLYGLQLSGPVLAPEQIAPRLELIDHLMSQTQSPVARRELEKAFDTLWTLHLEQ